MSFKDTEIGKIPSLWEIRKLGEVADVLDPHPSHRAPTAVQEGYPFAGIGDIDEYGNIATDKARVVSLEIVENHESNYIINNNSIGYGRVGTVGKVVKLKERTNYRYALSPTLAVINPNEIIDPKYLYSVVRSDIFFNQVYKYMTGSTRPSIGIQILRTLNIPYPPLQEQKAIANILSSLDEKIELNNQMNKNLEEMAQTLFKRWFVDFEFPNENGEPYKSSGGEMVDSELGMIPKGWKISVLDETITFQNGYAFKSKELLDEEVEDSYHVFKMGHINKGGGLNKQGTKSYIGKHECKNLERYVIKKGDLLMCMTDMKNNVALLGHTALMDEDNKYILNQRVGLLRSKDRDVMNYPYLYMLTNSAEFIEELRSRANSGVQVNLSTQEIKKSLIVIPDIKIHKLFNDIVEPIFEKKFVIGYQNDILIKFRDTLLPKLMSGEIRVPNIQN